MLMEPAIPCEPGFVPGICRLELLYLHALSRPVGGDPDVPERVSPSEAGHRVATILYLLSSPVVVARVGQNTGRPRGYEPADRRPVA